MKVRTRFAPSPTGFLHIGGARTALYAWLYAKKHQGEFMLRIEDTDLERSSQASIDAILQGMEWLGLDYEGEVVYQTRRLERYQQVINQLVNDGNAYYCQCSHERLQSLREQQLANKAKPRYDGHCRDLNLQPGSGPMVVRFRNPQEGEVEFTDQIHGKIVVANSELDDLVIQRSDGTPTYNMSVVVDDSDMEITHVLRGDDHINNTPRQINILRALNLPTPTYAHMPMILGDDGKRLSKRHGAVSVMQYRDEGFLPDAVINYIVRLGWSHGDQEIFSREELIEFFDIDAINKSASSFNTEKLYWLNQHYMREAPLPQLAEQLRYHLQAENIPCDDNSADLEAIIGVQLDRCKTLREMAEKSRYFFEDDVAYDDTAKQKFLTAEILPALELIYINLRDSSEWSQEAIHHIVRHVAEHFDLKLGKIAQPLRVALTGNTMSPSIDITIMLIGRERVLARLENVMKYLRQID